MKRLSASPLARRDTLLGVCQALGDDFGFNPIYLRVALALLLIWNPVVVAGTYAAAAVVITIVYCLFPDPAATAEAHPAGAAAGGELARDEEDPARDTMKLAA